ncbi:hypothetical protein [Salana multivorans]|nr:hypothetical protein [Salana multivorans]
MDDLVQIGMVNHATGHSTPSAWWSKYGMPAASRVAEGSLAEVLALPPREGKEGVVVHLADGTMVKIKQDDYVRLHRIVTGLNETTVWEALRTGTYWRLEREMPEEFRDWAWRIARPLLADHGLLVQGARQAHASAALAAPSKHYTERRTWRKEFARLANRSAYAPYIFAIEDGRDFYDMAWKAVRPKGPKPTGRTECAA